MVMSHEIGHNLGMKHDFDESHGGDSSACNGEGLMSYGTKPQKWSTCSVSDFTAHYNAILQHINSWCLERMSIFCSHIAHILPTAMGSLMNLIFG